MHGHSKTDKLIVVLDAPVRFGRSGGGGKCLLLALASGLAFFACKPRNPDDAGLLADDSPTPEGVATAPAASPGGRWTLTCSLSEGGATPTYTIGVTGAESVTDRSQSVQVSVARNVGAQRQVLVANAAGNGLIVPGDQIFLGFNGGALTTSVPPAPAPAAATPSKSSATLAGELNPQLGLLTLNASRQEDATGRSDGDGALGLNVSCAVAKGSRE